MLLSVALIAAVSFREPVVVPPVRELDYRDDVEVRLNEKTEIVVRGISLGRRTLISVSEYRELKNVTVKVNYTPADDVVARDVETDETIGRFGPADAAIPVSLDKARRCRQILLEPACRDFAAGVSGQSL